MFLKYQYVLYNHCKAINSAKYKNIDYTFDVKKPYGTLINNTYKTYYYIFSMVGISNVMSLLQTFCLLILSYGPVPKHLSFIMDGNRRFATSMNQPIKVGHELGSLTLLQIIYFAKTIGVENLSVYAFSIENFNRSENEVNLLMDLLLTKMTELSQKCTEKNIPDNAVFNSIQIKIVGDSSYLDDDLNIKISDIEKLTAIEANNVKLTLYICCPYTSRNEIYRSVKNNISLKRKDYDNYIISEKSLEKEMCLAKYVPNCQLLIRTSGETRFSDYLMWQTHECASLIFSTVFWPNYGFLVFVIHLFQWGFYKSLFDWNKNENKLKNQYCSEKIKTKSTKASCFLTKNKMIRNFVPSSFVSRLFFKKHHNIALDDLPKAPLAVTVTKKN